jgi:hypothetical protein
MNVERQERALLELIASDSARQCAAARAEAQARADAVRAQARAEALARIRACFAEQRPQMHERLAAARSRVATQRRLHEQQRVAAMLSLAGQQWPGELRALWADAQARRAWVDHVAGDATERLPGAGWQVRHAEGWSDAERRAWTQALAGRGIAAPDFVVDAALVAGLKVLAQGNVIDGSLAGLLADRAEFESRLLRALEEATS